MLVRKHTESANNFFAHRTPAVSVGRNHVYTHLIYEPTCNSNICSETQRRLDTLLSATKTNYTKSHWSKRLIHHDLTESFHVLFENTYMQAGEVVDTKPQLINFTRTSALITKQSTLP